jgi:4-hydroxybenzoyl-CoA reductase subunit beta
LDFPQKAANIQGHGRAQIVAGGTGCNAPGLKPPNHWRVVVRLPKFKYFEPKDMAEAVSFLQNNPSARILAGGTDLLVNMKHRVECPPKIVNIKKIANLDYIKQDNGDVRIGALTTLKRIYSTPLILEKLPAVGVAASSVGSYHHQAMGTLAGNICQQNRCKFFNQSQWWRSSRPTCFKAGGEICHVVNKKEVCYASYCGDVAPVLIALNATIVLTGPKDSREIPIEGLFSGNGKTPLNLKAGEILTEVIIPRKTMDGAASYIKFSNRASIDFPIVGTAFWASTKKKEYRVAFTAVDRKPLRGHQLEASLQNKDLSEEVVAEAADFAAKDAKPAKTSVYAPSYKRRMMGRLFQSAVNEAVRRSQ